MIKAKNIVLLLPALVAVTATVVCSAGLCQCNQRKRKQAKDSGNKNDERITPFYNEDVEKFLRPSPSNGLKEVGSIALYNTNAPQECEDRHETSVLESLIYIHDRALNCPGVQVPKSTTEPCTPFLAFEICSSTVSGAGDAASSFEKGTGNSIPASGAKPSAVSSPSEEKSQSPNKPSPSQAFGNIPFAAPATQKMTAFSCLRTKQGTAASDPTPDAANMATSFSLGSSQRGRSRTRRNRGARRGGRRGGGGRLVEAVVAEEAGGTEREGKRSRRRIVAPNDRS